MTSLLIGMTTFLLIRHGETDWNREGRLQGKSNEAQLTQQGEDQAENVANILFKSLKDKKIEIWTSGLARTDKTAAIIAKILNYPEHAIRSDARLKEADHGKFEGKIADEYELDPSYRKWEELSSKEQFFNAMDDERGESYDKVAKRAKAALKEIAEQNADTIKIIVTHGGVINALRKDLTYTYEFSSVKNGEIIVLQKSDHEFFLTSFGNFTNPLLHPKVEELRASLGLQLLQPSKSPQKKTCRLYLVHHGNTEWSEKQRLQGWEDLPLSLRGENQIRALSEKLSSVGISSIYSSSLQSAVETSNILNEKLSCLVSKTDLLRGEFHGDFEGLAKEEYEQHSHFQTYDRLPPEEEIFFPCGLNGESKADVAKRIVPFLKHIAQQHIGEDVVVVTHGSIFKLLSFYLGNYSPETGTMSIPNGELMMIEADSEFLYLK